MTDKTFRFALKCPKCWGNALFTDVMPLPRAPAHRADFYDKHGAPPVPGPAMEMLCPLCGGYLQTRTALLLETTNIERAVLVGNCAR